MKIRHILMLAAGACAVAAIPLAMAQNTAAQAEDGVAAQRAADAKAQSEVDARAQRRAAAAAQKAQAERQGKLGQGREEEEEKPQR